MGAPKCYARVTDGRAGNTNHFGTANVPFGVHAQAAPASQLLYRRLIIGARRISAESPRAHSAGSPASFRHQLVPGRDPQGALHLAQLTFEHVPSAAGEAISIRGSAACGIGGSAASRNRNWNGG